MPRAEAASSPDTRAQAEAASSGAVDDAIRVVVEGIRGWGSQDIQAGAVGSSHTPEVVDGPLAVADVPGGRLVTADSCRSHMQEVVGDLLRPLVPHKPPMLAAVGRSRSEAEAGGGSCTSKQHRQQ